MKTCPPFRSLACLAGVLLTVAACGGGGDEADGGDEGSPAPAATTETTMSPIAELMGWQSVSDEEASGKALEVEEMTATCMRDEGWEYTPVDWSALQPRGGADDEEMQLQVNDPEAYGKKYGYGIARNYELYELPAIESGDDPRAAKKVMADEQTQDPNQPYVDSLTESEREQYHISLDGDPAIWEGSEEEDFVQPSVEQMGCRGRASAEVWGDTGGEVDPDVQQRMDDYWTNLESDPRLQDAYAAWRDCMGDALGNAMIGDKPIDGPNDIYTYLNTVKLERMGMVFEALDPTVELTEDEMAGLYVISSSAAYSGEQRALADDSLEAFRQQELELWQRDHDCQEEAEIADIRHDLEQQFADQLRAEFPELAATEG